MDSALWISVIIAVVIMGIFRQLPTRDGYHHSLESPKRGRATLTLSGAVIRTGGLCYFDSQGQVTRFIGGDDNAAIDVTPAGVSANATVTSVSARIGDLRLNVFNGENIRFDYRPGVVRAVGSLARDEASGRRPGAVPFDLTVDCAIDI